jgi:hypothetical protein
MLRRGVKWTAIIAVASSVRNGRWYNETKSILQDKGLMPTDPKTIDKIRAADIEEARQRQLDQPPSVYKSVVTKEQRAAIKAKYKKPVAMEKPPVKEKLVKAIAKPLAKPVNCCDFS